MNLTLWYYKNNELVYFTMIPMIKLFNFIMLDAKDKLDHIINQQVNLIIVQK